jgi:sugar lactone lactonase YvrE
MLIKFVVQFLHRVFNDILISFQPGHHPGIATDGLGNIFVADDLNNTIRRITPSGSVSTLAGKVESVGSEDGIGADARFAGPRGVATDSLGNVYVADEQNHTIRKINSAGKVSTLAGTPEKGGSADGIGMEARFNFPEALAQDIQGTLYVSDAGNHTIRKILPAGVVSTLAGTAGLSGSADGDGAQARFYYPTGVAVDRAGNVYVADNWNNRIRRISAAGAVSTLAGSGAVGSADGEGATASFRICYKEFDYLSMREVSYCGPAGLATDAAGNVYVTDVYNHTIRKIDPAGRVSTLAGTPRSAGSVDGVGAQARFAGPRGIATDSLGNVYVADTGNLTIRKITPDGTVSTLAGATGLPGSADGNGKDARFGACWQVAMIGIVCQGPVAIATNGAADLYVADVGNRTIRKVTPAGAVTTVVGVAGANEFVPGPLPGSLTELLSGVAVVGTSLFITMPHGVAVVTNVP